MSRRWLVGCVRLGWSGPAAAKNLLPGVQIRWICGVDTGLVVVEFALAQPMLAPMAPLCIGA